jgi:hypothetical protein
LFSVPFTLVVVAEHQWSGRWRQVVQRPLGCEQ